MQFYHWSFLVLLLTAISASSYQLEDSVDDDRVLWLRSSGFPYNRKYNLFVGDDESESSESQSMESSEIESQTYKVPKKRNLSLLSWWKTLRQMQRITVPSYSATRSNIAQPIKAEKPTEEIFQMPEISKDIITAVSRGYRRTLRPPGQPLRFG